MKATENIESKISQLPPELMDELEMFIDYLLNKGAAKPQRKLRQDWAGGLSDATESALELQKKALEWRK